MSNETWKPGDKAVWTGAQVEVESLPAVARVRFEDGTRDLVPLSDLCRPLPPAAPALESSADGLTLDEMTTSRDYYRQQMQIANRDLQAAEQQRDEALDDWAKLKQTVDSAPALERLEEEAVADVLDNVLSPLIREMTVERYNTMKVLLARVVVARFGVPAARWSREGLEEALSVGHSLYWGHSKKPMPKLLLARYTDALCAYLTAHPSGPAVVPALSPSVRTALKRMVDSWPETHKLMGGMDIDTAGVLALLDGVPPAPPPSSTWTAEALDALLGEIDVPVDYYWRDVAREALLKAYPAGPPAGQAVERERLWATIAPMLSEWPGSAANRKAKEISDAITAANLFADAGELQHTIDYLRENQRLSTDRAKQLIRERDEALEFAADCDDFMASRDRTLEELRAEVERLQKQAVTPEVRDAVRNYIRLVDDGKFLFIGKLMDRLRESDATEPREVNPDEQG